MKHYRQKYSKTVWKLVKKYEMDKIKRVVLQREDNDFRWNMIETFFKATFKEVK